MPNRRTFLKAAAATVALQRAASPQSPPAAAEHRVYLTGDGLHLSTAEYAQLLATLAAGDAKADVYLKGGSVEELEGRFAKLLGKERGLFFPTGTLANHMAVRLLAGERRHVLVQEESHLYRDEGDCAQALSGLNLVPLAPGRATIKASEIVEAVDRAGSPPYPVPVGAISSPAMTCKVCDSQPCLLHLLVQSIQGAQKLFGKSWAAGSTIFSWRH
jgi:threonine aldolase